MVSNEAAIDGPRESSVHVEKGNMETMCSQSTDNYLRGLKLHLLTAGLGLSIFLVNFEISIVSTSLVSITKDLEEFGKSSWIVTAYLLTYTAFMVILAKLSDSVGRKTVLLACLALFTIFSGVCGVAQTINQLIAFRALQGLGGSGVYSLVMVVLFEMVRPNLYPRYTVLVTGLFIISLLTGPLLGGVINRNTTWRWVFLINVPAGAVALLVLVIFMPNNFPYHGLQSKKYVVKVRNLDIVGAGSMLGGITLLIVGLEEASNFAPWLSARVLTPLLLSVPTWVVFVWNSKVVTLGEGKRPEPVFPWRFFKNRVVMGIFANAFLCGAVFTSCIIQIPLRFQVVNNESSWHAGVRLIPFGIATPVGGAFTAAICKKRRVPVIYFLFPAAVFQILGLTFMSQLTLDDLFWKGQYGLQFLTGFGCGISMGVVTLMTPFCIEQKDLSTATSAVVQVRVLGGALVLAIITAVMNEGLKHTLARTVNPQDLERIFRVADTIHSIPEPLKTSVKDTFLKGFNLQLRILIGFAATEVPASLVMWQAEPVRID